MKQALKNETAILDLINKIQAQLTELDKKVDTLINRSTPQTKPSPTPTVNNPHPAVRPNDHNKGRTMHKAICADCRKECSIPFKPSGDRPVYCQDCFSRRKVISLSGITVTSPTPVAKETNTPKPPVKEKKKTITLKKPIGKKKVTPKKK